jgi:anti-anti-sigma factor
VSLSIKSTTLATGVIELALRGELDYASAQELRAAVTAALHVTGARDIVVDLAAVTFLDSTGIGTLVVAKRICGDIGIALSVRNANPFIARLLTVVGVAETLGVPPAPEPPRTRPLPRQRLDAPASRSA